MKVTLKVDIRCGEKTCASEPGKFCAYFGTRRFSSVPLCLLFPDARGGSVTELHPNEDGWIARCDDCMKAGA